MVAEFAVGKTIFTSHDIPLNISSQNLQDHLNNLEQW